MNDIDFKAFRSDAPRELAVVLFFAVVLVAALFGFSGCSAVEARLEQGYLATEDAAAGAEAVAERHEAAVDGYDAEARRDALALARERFAARVYSESRPTDTAGVMRAYDDVHGLTGLAARLDDQDRKRKERLARDLIGALLRDTTTIRDIAAHLHLSFEKVRAALARAKTGR